MAKMIPPPPPQPPEETPYYFIGTTESRGGGMIHVLKTSDPVTVKAIERLIKRHEKREHEKQVLAKKEVG